ncbi:MAG: alanine and proline-rich secreted protein Apa [Planctomycetaceae bacterium]|nr:alanine and proline-rich secreted protein Apa [Planctomycetaceae bacterium]
MSEKLVSSVLSALVGGVVGAAVVFFMGAKTKFDNLEVAQLKITQQAVLVDKDGKDDVILKDGSVLANQVVLGKKFIGTQYQGHVFVGNRIFTTPDNLNEKPMDQWRFFTEMGSSNELGGEVIVRSKNGANVVGQEVTQGWILRNGFDANNEPGVLAVSNQNKAIAKVPFFVPRPPNANPNAPEPQPADGSGQIAAPVSVPGTEMSVPASTPVAEVPGTVPQ